MRREECEQRGGRRTDREEEKEENEIGKCPREVADARPLLLLSVDTGRSPRHRLLIFDRRSAY